MPRRYRILAFRINHPPEPYQRVWSPNPTGVTSENRAFTAAPARLLESNGAIAQLVERRVRNAKVRGSIPLSSTGQRDPVEYGRVPLRFAHRLSCLPVVSNVKGAAEVTDSLGSQKIRRAVLIVALLTLATFLVGFKSAVAIG